jgi:hypothetical protein
MSWEHGNQSILARDRRGGDSWRSRRSPHIDRIMPRKPKLKPDNPEQFKRFLETAREVEVDENPKALDRAFRKVTRRPLDRRAPIPSARKNRSRSK